SAVCSSVLCRGGGTLGVRRQRAEGQRAGRGSHPHDLHSEPRPFRFRFGDVALPLSSEAVGRLRSLEGLELGRLDLERLLSLEAKFAKEGLTFDDVLLVPGESGGLPNDASTRTRFTRGISIEVPVLSAAMDTVTEAPMAIALAREGGIGVVHRNLSIP